jgi:hypothetical protein
MQPIMGHAYTGPFYAKHMCTQSKPGLAMEGGMPLGPSHAGRSKHAQCCLHISNRVTISSLTQWHRSSIQQQPLKPANTNHTLPATAQFRIPNRAGPPIKGAKAAPGKTIMMIVRRHDHRSAHVNQKFNSGRVPPPRTSKSPLGPKLRGSQQVGGVYDPCQQVRLSRPWQGGGTSPLAKNSQGSLGKPPSPAPETLP